MPIKYRGMYIKDAQDFFLEKIVVRTTYLNCAKGSFELFLIYRRSERLSGAFGADELITKT